jgi:xanthine dehydrogenase accessory factor
MELRGIGEVLSAAAEAQQQGEGLAIAVVVKSACPDLVAPATRMLVPESGPVVGTIHPNLDALVLEDARDGLATGRSQMRSYDLAGGSGRARLQRGEVDVFFEVIGRPPALIIVGAGHIAVPLCRFAVELGFEVTVLDDRAEYATKERFPTAAHIVVGPYRESLSALPIDANTYAVLVTRGHVHDQACLEYALTTSAAYIGMIGSRRRVQTVMDHALERGADPERLREVRSPVGLDIGAQTPAEIALSIMAEIVNYRRGGGAGGVALRGRRLAR